MCTICAYVHVHLPSPTDGTLFTVRALEQAKAMGGGENAEELLQLIADQVQMRQKQQAAMQQQQQKATLPVKSTGTQVCS